MLPTIMKIKTLCNSYFVNANYSLCFDYFVISKFLNIIKCEIN